MIRLLPWFIAQVLRAGYAGYYAVEVFNTHYWTLSLDVVARRAMDPLSALFEA